MVTPHLSDSMERLYAGGAQLRPMHDGTKLCGPAFTVRTSPGDNLLVHKAIDTAEPGDVIVVDAGGVNDNAIIGELMSARAEQRGVGGMVIWGAIRDSKELSQGSFPVYASGVTHRGPYKNGPGEINVTHRHGGMTGESRATSSSATPTAWSRCRRSTPRPSSPRPRRSSPRKRSR